MAGYNNSRPFDTVKMQGRNGPGSRAKIQAPPRALSTPMPNGAPPVPTATMYDDDALDALSNKYMPQSQPKPTAQPKPQTDPYTPKVQMGLMTPPKLPTTAPTAYPNPDHQPQQLGAGNMYDDASLDMMAQANKPVYTQPGAMGFSGAEADFSQLPASKPGGGSSPYSEDPEDEDVYSEDPEGSDPPYAVKTNEKGMWLDQFGEWHPAGDTATDKDAPGVTQKQTSSAPDDTVNLYPEGLDPWTNPDTGEPWTGEEYAAAKGTLGNTEEDVDQSVIDGLLAGLDTTPGISDEALAKQQAAVAKAGNLAQANMSQQMAASGLVGSGAEGYNIGSIDTATGATAAELGFKTEQFNADQMRDRISQLAGLYQGAKGDDLAAEQMGLQKEQWEQYKKDNGLSNAMTIVNNMSAAVGANRVNMKDLPALLTALDEGIKAGTPLKDILAQFNLVVGPDGAWESADGTGDDGDDGDEGDGGDAKTTTKSTDFEGTQEEWDALTNYDRDYFNTHGQLPPEE